MNISVSIVIPMYNVAPYVADCISSVAAQTYKGEIECILVNDCSPDQSVEVAEKAITAYQGPIAFRIVHQEKNSGVSEARNRGIREAKNDFLYFLDGDDMITPDCIELMVSKIEEHPDCQCVYASFASDDPTMRWMDFTQKPMKEYSNDPDWVRRAIINRYYFKTSPCNRLISRSLVVDNNLYFCPGIRYEDELWNFDLSRYLNSVAVLQKNTYLYVPHAQSFMHSISDVESWNRLLNLCRLLMGRLSEAPYKGLELCAIWNIINDRMLWTPIPTETKPAVREMIFGMARQAPLLLSLQLGFYGTLLFLPRPAYRNNRIQKVFKKWFHFAFE